MAGFKVRHSPSLIITCGATSPCVSPLFEIGSIPVLFGEGGLSVMSAKDTLSVARRNTDTGYA